MSLVPAAYRSVRCPDGLRLNVWTAGDPERTPILFIHGFSQCHLSWRHQFESALSNEFRLVAFDLRGHGWSDKPERKEAYRDDGAWAGDVAAVVEQTGLRRPVIVAWSYGARVACDYLAASGPASVAGVNFIAPLLSDEDAHFGEDIGLVGGTCNADPATSIDMLRRFVRACTARPLDTDEFETVLAYSAMVPPPIRRFVLGRRIDVRALLPKLDMEVLFSQGSLDRIISPAMSEFAAALLPNAGISRYEGVGHSPFCESAARFNRELADFARTCSGGDKEPTTTSDERPPHP